MIEYTAYPKVYHLGHPKIERVLMGNVVVQEKVDGSQISFGKRTVNGKAELFINSHHKDISFVRGEYGQFTEAIAWIVQAEASLKPDLVYRGEVVSKPKHNIITYGRVPRNGIILFDIMRGPEAYMGYMDVVQEGIRIGLETVPLLFYGNVAGEQDIERLLSRPSVLGGLPEGVVIKNYGQFDDAGKPMMAKWVTPAFREIKKIDCASNSETGWWEKIVAKYRTVARFHKAVQRLAEEGKLSGEPKDIGLLMTMVRDDFRDEAVQTLAIDLLAHYQPDVERAVVSGLPEWYKEQLRTKAFDAMADTEHWNESSNLMEVSDEELDGLTK